MFFFFSGDEFPPSLGKDNGEEHHRDNGTTQRRSARYDSSQETLTATSATQRTDWSHGGKYFLHHFGTKAFYN